MDIALGAAGAAWYPMAMKKLRGRQGRRERKNIGFAASEHGHRRTQPILRRPSPTQTYRNICEMACRIRIRSRMHGSLSPPCALPGKQKALPLPSRQTERRWAASAFPVGATSSGRPPSSATIWPNPIGAEAWQPRRSGRYAFDHSDILRVYAEVFESNAASCRVLEKAGFKLEGRLRCGVVKSDRALNTRLYAPVREAPLAPSARIEP